MSSTVFNGTFVLVHPGSLFGSARMNVGRERARLVRQQILRHDIRRAERLVIVLGPLAEEFRGTPFERACSAPRTRRLEAGPTDHGLGKAATRIANADTSPFMITGAWANPGTGCACKVARKLREIEREAYVSKHALQEEDWAWDDGEKSTFHEPRGFR